ncbi:MAG: M56 family metallopeptidase [Candidatus Zixiibacteriota bacterium]
MNPFSQIAAGDGIGFVLFCTAKVSLILLLVFGLYILARKKSASMRHFILTVGLVATIAVPMLALTSFRWEILSLGSASDTHATEKVLSTEVSAVTPSAKFGITPAPVTPASQHASRSGADWTIPVLSLAYLIGCTFVMLRLLGGFMYSRRYLRSAEPAYPTHPRLVRLGQNAARQIELHRKVELMLSDKVKIPFACGLFRPAVVLPSGAAAWSDDRLMAVLLHELSHVRRYDNVLSLLSQLALAWQWFNPLVWMLVGKLNREREIVCDDIVLAAGVNDTDYAHHLVQINSMLTPETRLAASAMAFSRTSKMEGRIMSILDRTRDRRTVAAGKMFLIGLLFAVTTAPLASLAQKPQGTVLEGVSESEQEEIVNTLMEFYDALNAGGDFGIIREQFLSRDYFDRPELTVENLMPGEFKSVVDHMLSVLDARRTGFRQISNVAVKSILNEGGRYILTLRTSVGSGDPERQIGYVVKDLEHRIEIVREDGRFKVSRYDDGISVMRMDIDNPYGPILVIWIKMVDKSSTPLAPWVSKVIPASLGIEDAVNMQFSLEEN